MESRNTSLLPGLSDDPGSSSVDFPASAPSMFRLTESQSNGSVSLGVPLESWHSSEVLFEDELLDWAEVEGPLPFASAFDIA